MSVKSVLSAIGGDVFKVFAFIGSPKGLAVIQTGENLAVAAAEVHGGPAAANVVGSFLGLANNWLVEILKTEALAAAAAQQTGSGAAKATAVLATIGPQVVAFAQEHGLPVPTGDRLLAANTALVAFGNAFAGAPDVNVVGPPAHGTA